MLKNLNRVWAAAAIVAALGAAAMAGVNVGDKPVIRWQSVDHQWITSQALSGKIVIIDFWATWCGPCMREAPHMVRLNNKYKSKGVQIIGISLDSNVSRMKQVAKKNGLNWPQVCDGKGWKSDYAQTFGVNSIPRTFILSPDGEVLWTGHPGNIDQPLADALVKHPPTFKKRDRATAHRLLRSATAHLNKGRWTDVVKDLAELPAGPLSEPKMARSIRTFMFGYNRIAGSSSLAAKKMAKALAANAKATARLAAMQKIVPARGASAAARRTTASVKAATHSVKLAAIHLRHADQYRKAGKDIEAYRLYKRIVTQFGKTKVAAKARPRVQAYEKDESFMAKMAQADREAKANRHLMMARSYLKAGRKEQAIAECNQVLEKYPQTRCATEAAQIKHDAQPPAPPE